MTQLQVKNLYYSINDQEIVKDVTLEIQEGEFIGLVGPNGCGKSTLLKNIYRVYSPDKGIVYLEGTDISRLSNRETARKMSVMVQENNIEFDMYVMDMVLLGRYAHKKLLGETTSDDRRIAKEALQKVGLEAYGERSYLSLSGGEKQRVLIARALTQQAKMIILDEPTNHLDVGYQYQIMNILKSQNITVFSAVHDLNIAAYYCDKVILMNQGQIIKYGKPEDVFTPECIESLFNISAEITIGKNGKLHIYYVPE